MSNEIKDLKKKLKARLEKIKLGISQCHDNKCVQCGVRIWKGDEDETARLPDGILPVDVEELDENELLQSVLTLNYDDGGSNMVGGDAMGQWCSFDCFLVWLANSCKCLTSPAPDPDAPRDYVIISDQGWTQLPHMEDGEQAVERDNCQVIDFFYDVKPSDLGKNVANMLKDLEKESNIKLDESQLTITEWKPITGW